MAHKLKKHARHLQDLIQEDPAGLEPIGYRRAINLMVMHFDDAVAKVDGEAKGNERRLAIAEQVLELSRPTLETKGAT